MVRAQEVLVAVEVVCQVWLEKQVELELMAQTDLEGTVKAAEGAKVVVLVVLEEVYLEYLTLLEIMVSLFLNIQSIKL